MTREQFFQLLGGVEPAYVLQAQRPRKNRRARSRWFAAAACLCLMAAGSVYSLNRLGYFGASCSANPGTIVDGTYYYFEDHSGIYAYDNGKTEKILGAWWVEEWSVNDYGVYYSCGRTFGVVPHETGRREVLYRASPVAASFVRHTLRPDGSVVLTIYDRRAEEQEELLLDGASGEILATVMERRYYDDVDIPYSESHYVVGDRELVLVPTSKSPHDYDLQEEGRSILPDGVTVQSFSAARYFGDSLYFICTYPEKYREGSAFFVRPEGGDTFLTIPANHYYNTGTAEYLMDVQYTGEGYEVWCLDTMTNETWELSVGEGPAIYSIDTDGTVAYACVPWEGYHALWKVVCDEKGRPAALELLDGDIRS